MTTKELSQLYYLEREIVLIRRQLCGLRSQLQELCVFDGVQASSKYEPYQKHSQLISGVRQSAKSTALTRAISERKAKLADTLVRREQERARLEQYITSIPDSLTRQIFMQRFMQCKSWNEIADSTGKEITEDSVKKKCYRYIKNNP